MLSRLATHCQWCSDLTVEALSGDKARLCRYGLEKPGPFVPRRQIQLGRQPRVSAGYRQMGTGICTHSCKPCVCVKNESCLASLTSLVAMYLQVSVHGVDIRAKFCKTLQLQASELLAEVLRTRTQLTELLLLTFQRTFKHVVLLTCSRLPASLAAVCSRAAFAYNDSNAVVA